MSVYFETAVQFTEHNVISTNEMWHPSASLLAVASYSQERGGFVTIFDELGEQLPNVTFPVHAVSQVTALCWHPEHKILFTGWENGEMKVWNGIDKDFINLVGPHKAPIILIDSSEKGSRLVSCDSTGSLVGWKVDSKGQTVMVFHHDLKESITHLTFRLTSRNSSKFNIGNLAKAAVNGDEHALDVFSDWRPKTTARKLKTNEGSDNHCFFVGTQNGSVYYINDAGVCIEVLNTEGVPLSYILYHPSKNSLVVMMEGLTIGHFSVDSQGQLMELTKVKLSGRGQAIRGIGSQGLVWADNSCLAVLTGDLIVRLWDIDSNDNYVLPTKFKSNTDHDDSRNHHGNEVFNCIAYSKPNQTLCASTNMGHIYFWGKKQEKKNVFSGSEDLWELKNINTLRGTIKQIIWGSENLRTPLLAVNCVTEVYMMREQSLCTCFSERIWATQQTANKVLLETAETRSIVHADMQVTNMSINENNIAFTNGRLIAVYDIIWMTNSPEKISYAINFDASKMNINDKSNLKIKLINSFTCNNEGKLQKPVKVKY